MNAWLLTWEGTEPETIFDNDNKIVTILSGRTSSKSVEFIVYVLYTRCLWTAGDITYTISESKYRMPNFPERNHGGNPN